MTAANKWSEENGKGVVRKNSLLRAKLTLTAKATGSTADAAVDDYYEFNCKSKGMPAYADAPTWTDVTDNPSEPTGYAYAGKPEQLNTIALVTRTPLMVVYDNLAKHQAAGDIFTLTLTYDDPHETYTYSVSVVNCQIVGLSPEGGENKAGSQTTITVLPEGGTSGNMPTVASTARS